MPIIQITSAETKEKYSKQQMMENIENRINCKLPWSKDRILIYFQRMEPKEYLHKGQFSDCLTEDDFPVIAYLHYADGKDEDDMRLICEIIASEIVNTMKINLENVSIVRVPLQKGHLYKQGKFI